MIDEFFLQSPTPDGLASSRVEPVEIEYLVPHNRDQVLEVTEQMVSYVYPRYLGAIPVMSCLIFCS